LTGIFWLKPIIGTRLLSLEQETHNIGSSLILKDKSPSTLFFIGNRFELIFDDDQGGKFVPWLFAGFTREYNNIAPMGPSVFFADQASGNAFTLFPKNSFNAPTTFPAKNTGVLGAGFDFNIRNVALISMSIHREYNELVVGTNFLVKANIKW
jgi:hypothetical protein